jgi:methylthioribulose-1-phosphate dehydratase
VLFQEGAVTIEGYEIMKGLSGVKTHEHREIVPVVENSQDHIALSHVVENVLRDNHGIHGVYLRRHGLYAWGETVGAARRHVEILEYLFEVTARQLK